MVLFSCVTETINQLTKCHYKGNILNCDFLFSPSHFMGTQPNSSAAGLKNYMWKLKTKLLNCQWHLGMPLWKPIAYKM